MKAKANPELYKKRNNPPRLLRLKKALPVLQNIVVMTTDKVLQEAIPKGEANQCPTEAQTTDEEKRGGR